MDGQATAATASKAGTSLANTSLGVYSVVAQQQQQQPLNVVWRRHKQRLRLPVSTCSRAQHAAASSKQFNAKADDRVRAATAFTRRVARIGHLTASSQGRAACNVHYLWTSLHLTSNIGRRSQWGKGGAGRGGSTVDGTARPGSANACESIICCIHAHVSRRDIMESTDGGRATHKSTHTHTHTQLRHTTRPDTFTVRLNENSPIGRIAPPKRKGSLPSVTRVLRYLSPKRRRIGKTST
jgi:hypothetical protein